jgi:hypothetical protein
MERSGPLPQRSCSLKDLSLLKVCIDKLVCVGRLQDFGDITGIFGGVDALVNIGSAGTNAGLLNRAAGSFMNFKKQSPFATEIGARSYFVVAHQCGGTLALVLPLEFASKFQAALQTSGSNFMASAHDNVTHPPTQKNC